MNAESGGWETAGRPSHTHLMSIARAWYERSGYSRFEAIDFSPVPGFLVMGFAKDLTREDASSVNSRAVAFDSGANRELSKA